MFVCLTTKVVRVETPLQLELGCKESILLHNVYIFAI